MAIIAVLLLCLADHAKSQEINEVDSIQEELIIEEESKILRFTKSNITHSADSILFNILTITNDDDDLLEGELIVSLPDNWSIKMMNPITNISLAKGEKLVLPFWISADKNAIGGTSYIVTANLKGKKSKKIISEPFYISVPKRSSWYISALEKTQFFPNRRNILFSKVALSNSGNCSENISILIEQSQQLRLRGYEHPKAELYIELPARTDTILEFEVIYRDGDDEMNFLINSGNYLKFTAVNGLTRTTAAYFYKLENTFNNEELLNLESPLTVEVNFGSFDNNAFSNLNILAHGKLEFSEKRYLRYRFNIPNLRPVNDATLAEHVWRYGLYLINYRHDDISVSIGDVTANGIDFGSFGRGIQYDQRIGSNSIGGGVNYNMFQPIFTYGLRGSTRIFKRAYLSAGGAVQEDEFNKIRMENIAAMVNFSLLKKHSFTAFYGLGRMNHQFTEFDFAGAQDADTTLQGFRAKLGHVYRGSKFHSTTMLDYTSQYYTGQNGTENLRNTLVYTLGSRSSVAVNSYYFKTNPYRNFQGRIIEGVFQQTNYGTSMSINHNLSSRTRLNLLGGYNRLIIPSFYSQLNGFYDNQIEVFNSRFNSSYQLSSTQKISAYVGANFTRFLDYYNPESSLTGSSTGIFFPSTNIGISYNERNRGISVDFNRGIIPGTQIQLMPFYTQNSRIFIRPYFNKRFLNDMLFVQANGNIMLQSSNSFENYNANIMAEISPGRGWLVRTNFTYGLMRREIEEGNTITSRNFFINMGLVKKFDLPQPRVKYYNLTVMFFKDLNGDGIKDENEPPLENIIAEINQNSDRANESKGQFSNTSMISGFDGIVQYIKIPEGSYEMTSISLVNLRDIYNANGPKQFIEIFGNTTVYVPFIESYSVSGKIEVKRSKFSDAGKIDIDNIAVQAISDKGESYKALTNKAGQFKLYVPPVPGNYRIVVANAFEENFVLEQEEFLVNFNGLKTFQVVFKFVERERGINIQGGYQFKALQEDEEDAVNAEEAKKESPTENKAAPANTAPANDGSLNKAQEKALQNKIDDLQRQIDELRNLIQNGAIPSAPSNNIQPPQQNVPEGQPFDPMDDLMNNLLEKTNPNTENINLNRVSFRVQLGVYKDRVPVAMINRLISLGSAETGENNDDGSTKFISKPFGSKAEAEQYQQQLQTEGFEGVKVIGDYAGKTISIEEAETLIEKRKQGGN